MIDTLKAKEAGFTKEQIEVLKDLDEATVTKKDLSTDLSNTQSALMHEIRAVELRLESKLAALEARLGAKFDNLAKANYVLLGLVGVAIIRFLIFGTKSFL